MYCTTGCYCLVFLFFFKFFSSYYVKTLLLLIPKYIAEKNSDIYLNNPIRMSEKLFRNFQLLVCCGLLHQLSVTEISNAFCHSVWAGEASIRGQARYCAHIQINIASRQEEGGKHQPASCLLQVEVYCILYPCFFQKTISLRPLIFILKHFCLA